MKKITISSLLTLAVVCPATAEVNVDITAGTTNPGCTNSVLHTYSAPTSLQAEYSPNTINLKWYDADGEITTVPNASKTCTYDGSITLPTTNPTRTGYTFAGWQVRHYVNPLSSIDYSIDGNAYYAHGWDNTNNEDYCDNNDISMGYEQCSLPVFNDLGVNDWKVEFSYGTIYGEASCNTTSNAAAEYSMLNLSSVAFGEMNAEEFIYGFSQVATQDQVALVTDALTQLANGDKNIYETFSMIVPIYSSDSQMNKNSNGQYCWCRGTGYTPTNGTKQSIQIPWMYYYDTGSADACKRNCAWFCANDTKTNAFSRYASKTWSAN